VIRNKHEGPGVLPGRYVGEAIPISGKSHILDVIDVLIIKRKAPASDSDRTMPLRSQPHRRSRCR
jgi:hypothetical protein